MMKLRAKEIVFTFIYLLVATLIMYFAVQNKLKETNEYIDSVFAKMNLIIRDTGEFNAENAQDIQALVDNGKLYTVRENNFSNLKVQRYANRNEFGFNQGIFPEVTAKGTLIGRGEPGQLVLENPGHFLILDRMWAFYDQSSIFNYHFLISFKSDYVYLSQRVSNEHDQPLYSDSYVNNHGLTLNIDNVEAQKKKYGYFFTRPYFSPYTGKRVVSVVSPIVENGQLIADVGISIELLKLASTVSLYPKLKDKVNFYINFTYDTDDFVISKANYDLLPVYKHEYEIADFGVLTASYDISLLIQENLSLFLLLLFLYVLIIANSRRYEKGKEKEREIKHLLKLDPMTMLYNRRGLDDILDNELQAYSQTDTPIALVAIDANKFKQINDIHGHQIGDKAIEFIANTLKKFVNNNGYCIRMGGDEFLLILPEHNIEQAEQVISKVLDYLATFSQSIVGVPVSVTAACTLLDNNESFDQAYHRVDEHMFHKKIKNGDK